jgi:hypothetical protein
MYYWFKSGPGTSSPLYQAMINSYVDFFFIIAYTGMLRLVSRRLMRKEENPVFRFLLRMNIILALFAGLLDIFENIILLYNMQGYYPGEYYISAMYAGIPKWLLIGFIIFIWILSLAKRSIKGLPK